MKKKVLLPSVLTVALCAVLIVGAAFALFAKSSKVDIAVNSGKVEVSASIEEDSLKLYSIEQISQDENADDEYVLQNGSFINGGTATIGGGSLVINNISPGDKAEFSIAIRNYSTITAKYRVTIGSEEDNGLYKYLVTSFDGAPSGWQTVEPEADPSAPETKYVKVSVELPKTAGAEAGGLSARLVFAVEAVQGNAVVPTSVGSVEELKAALDDDSIKTIELLPGVYDLTGNTYLDGNGFCIDRPVEIIGAGENTVLKVGSTDMAISGQAYFFITANDVTLSDVVVESAQTGTSTSTLFNTMKISSLNDASEIVRGTTMRNVTFTGVTNNHIDVNGAENVLFENVVFGDADSKAYKCAVSVSNATGVKFVDSAIASGAWGSVGVMYKAGNNGSSVSFENCNIAGIVYSEYPEAGNDINEIKGLDGWAVLVQDNKNGDVYQTAWINSEITVGSFAELQTALSSGLFKTVVLNNDIEWSAQLTVNAGVTLLGNGHTITITEDAVKTAGVHVCMNVNGTVDGVNFDLNYDNTTNHGAVSILMPYSNAVIRNCVFTGTYNMGDGEITRGIESASGAENVLIENNGFYNLRQPAYLNSAKNGVVRGNTVDETRGFCVANDGWTFTGNTFKNTTQGDQEVCEICFFDSTTQLSDEQYCKISTDNGGCYVQDQRAEGNTDYKNGVKVS